MADPKPAPAPAPTPVQDPWIVRAWYSDLVQGACRSLGHLLGSDPAQTRISPINMLQIVGLSITVWFAANTGLLHLDPGAAAGVTFAAMTLAHWLAGRTQAQLVPGTTTVTASFRPAADPAAVTSHTETTTVPAPPPAQHGA